jgi:NADH-quinone oxidoreductase subunit K
MLLFTGLILFVIGINGLWVVRKSIIVLLMCIELMLLGINLAFIYVSLIYDDMLGQVISLFVLTVAASESAIGLAILVAYYRIRQILDINYLIFLKS